MELRASYEQRDEGIQLDFSLVNTTSEPLDIGFSSGQQFEIYIVDESGEEVYRFSEGRFFTMAMTTKHLLPGESLQWRDTWNYFDKNGNKRDGGNYKVIVKIKGMVEENFEDQLIKQMQINI